MNQKSRMMRSLVGFMLTLALVVGLMPQFTFEAKAALPAALDIEVKVTGGTNDAAKAYTDTGLVGGKVLPLIGTKYETDKQGGVLSAGKTSTDTTILTLTATGSSTAALTASTYTWALETNPGPDPGAANKVVLSNANTDAATLTITGAVDGLAIISLTAMDNEDPRNPVITKATYALMIKPAKLYIQVSDENGTSIKTGDTVTTDTFRGLDVKVVNAFGENLTDKIIAGDDGPPIVRGIGANDTASAAGTPVNGLAYSADRITFVIQQATAIPDVYFYTNTTICDDVPLKAYADAQPTTGVNDHNGFHIIVAAGSGIQGLTTPTAVHIAGTKYITVTVPADEKRKPNTYLTLAVGSALAGKTTNQLAFGTATTYNYNAVKLPTNGEYKLVFQLLKNEDLSKLKFLYSASSSETANELYDQQKVRALVVDEITLDPATSVTEFEYAGATPKTAFLFQTTAASGKRSLLAGDKVTLLVQYPEMIISGAMSAEYTAVTSQALSAPHINFTDAKFLHALDDGTRLIFKVKEPVINPATGLSMGDVEAGDMIFICNNILPDPGLTVKLDQFRGINLNNNLTVAVSTSSKTIKKGDKIALTVLYPNKTVPVSLGTPQVSTTNSSVLFPNAKFAQRPISGTSIEANIYRNGESIGVYSFKITSNSYGATATPALLAKSVVLTRTADRLVDAIKVSGVKANSTVRLYSYNADPIQCVKIAEYVVTTKTNTLTKLLNADNMLGDYAGGKRAFDSTGKMYITIEDFGSGLAESVKVLLYYATTEPKAVAHVLDIGATQSAITVKAVKDATDVRLKFFITDVTIPNAPTIMYVPYDVTNSTTAAMSITRASAYDFSTEKVAKISTSGALTTVTDNVLQMIEGHVYSVCATNYVLGTTSESGKSNTVYFYPQSSQVPTPAPVKGQTVLSGGAIDSASYLLENKKGNKDTVTVGVLPVGYTILVVDTAAYDSSVSGSAHSVKPIPANLNSNGSFLSYKDGVVLNQKNRLVGVVASAKVKARTQTTFTLDLEKYEANGLFILVVADGNDDSTRKQLRSLGYNSVDNPSGIIEVLGENSDLPKYRQSVSLTVVKGEGKLVYIAVGVLPNDTVTLYSSKSATGKSIKAKENYVVFTDVKEDYNQISIARVGYAPSERISFDVDLTYNSATSKIGFNWIDGETKLIGSKDLEYSVK